MPWAWRHSLSVLIRKKAHLWRFAFVLSIALYVLSLVLPESFCVDGQCSGWPGYGVALLGELAFFWSPANLCWLVNPLVLMAWIMLWNDERRTAFLFAVAAFALAVVFMGMRKVVTGEDGGLRSITGLRAGYWAWLLSTGVACCAAVLRLQTPSTLPGE
jgi:hypothetical protein